MSIRFQADADLKFAIVKTVRRREPAIDFATAAVSGLRGLGDPEVLERSAAEGRILVSHDHLAMVAYFRERLEKGKSSPGLLMVTQDEPVVPVAEAIILIWAASDPAEWRDQIYHLPTISRHIFAR